MEDLGRFLARIPRRLGLWWILEGVRVYNNATMMMIYVAALSTHTYLDLLIHSLIKLQMYSVHNIVNNVVCM